MGCYNHAEVELALLGKTTPDALILPFKDEILALCKKFGDSGESGGSAHYTAGAISQAVKKLMLFEPIVPITGDAYEWSGDLDGAGTYQNVRLSSVFKQGIDGKPYYLDAIVWEEVMEDGHVFAFTGRVCLDDTRIVSSRQYIKGFPFTPKTFYVRVVTVGELYRLENPDALLPVWEYYDECE